MLYAWVWMPLVALTSVSPLAPYSKRQTEGHFVERLRTGLVIQHGPERASDWSIVSTIAPCRTSANLAITVLLNATPILIPRSPYMVAATICHVGSTPLHVERRTVKITLVSAMGS